MEKLARREIGYLPPYLPYFPVCPWLARASVRFHQRLAVRLDTHLNDTVALTVSHENSCRFCYATVRALMRIQGMSEARVQALETRLDGADGDPRTAAAIAFARQMARGAPLVTAADRERLEKAGFDPEESREIAFVAAYMTFGNRLTTIPAIQAASVTPYHTPSAWSVPRTR